MLREIGKMFKIGSLEFPTKMAAKKRLSMIVEELRPGELIIHGKNFEVLLEVVSIHPWHSNLKRDNIAGFRVVLNEYRTKVLNIVRQDGSEVKLSAGRIFETRNPNKREKFVEKCRKAVSQQIIDFKRDAFGDMRNSYVYCALTGVLIGWGECHIDHIYPFECMVKDFEKTINCDYSTKSVVQFTIYHYKYAQLRVVSTKANLSRKDHNCE